MSHTLLYYIIYDRMYAYKYTLYCLLPQIKACTELTTDYESKQIIQMSDQTGFSTFM